MSGEDTTLRVELEKLEIEAKRLNATLNDENPFHRRYNAAISRGSPIWNSKCACSQNRKSIKSTTTFKRGSNKILKDPVLKYIATCQNGSKCEAAVQPCTVSSKQEAASVASLALPSVSALTVAPTQAFRNATAPPNEDFSSLVNNCDKLRISFEADNRQLFTSHSFHSIQEEAVRQPGAVSAGSASTTAGPSCSQQALNPPCDITIDELASYFETMVHIPKKMSTMAEMMYI